MWIALCGSKALEDCNERTRRKTAWTEGKKEQSSRGKETKEVYESLYDFFTDLLEDGLPFATRIV